MKPTEAAWCGPFVRFIATVAMIKKFAPLAVLLMAGGCRMCSDCCDYSSPVPGGAPMGPTRSGSVLSGGLAAAEPVPMPAVVDGNAQPLTPLAPEFAR